MTTQQAMEALHALPRLGSGRPGLDRMKICCSIWVTRSRTCSVCILPAPTAREVWRP